MSGLRVPGVLGGTTNSPSIDSGTLIRTASPVPGPVIIGSELAAGVTSSAASVELLAAGVRTFDIDKAVEHLKRESHATSQGACARYVRLAIEAGGIPIPPPRPTYAKDYGPTLTELGFGEIAAEDYVPQKGDVVVLQPPEGQTAGHIQMFEGEGWRSDFTQSPGIYPGPAYRNQKVKYKIYRFKTIAP